MKNTNSPSLKSNFIFNLLNTVVGLLFPLITVPYVSRIFFAEGIGQVHFFQSIISYIILCTSLGIPIYAIREIARVRADAKERCKVTVEVLILHSAMMLLGYFIVFMFVSYSTKVQVDIPLFLLFSLSIFFTVIGVNWFYQGIEDFKYIAIRSLIVRLLSLISLFIFVETKDDLFKYALILVVAEAGSNILNFFRLRKHLNFSLFMFRELNIKRHIAPALKVFSLSLVISLYVNLDSVMLGFMKDEAAVGFYSMATRLTKCILGIIVSFGIVLLPRFSNMISNNQFDEFKQMANKAVGFVIALSLPMAVCVIFTASPLIRLFAGEEFGPSVVVLQLLSPIILFISLSSIISMQVLYPQGKENIALKSTGTGAITNFTLNLLLIPQFSYIGAAFSTAIAECLVLVVLLIAGRKYLPIQIFSKINLHYLIGTCLIALSLYLLSLFILNEMLYMFIGMVVSWVIYILYLYIVKNELTLQLIENATRRIKSKL